MQTIYKYRVPITDMPVIDMPIGARVISFHTQDGEPCIWAIVETDNPIEPRRFYMMGTGHPAQFSLEGMRFIGTVLMGDDRLVWHLFEMP